MNNRELLRQSVEYSFLQSADTLDSRYAAKLLTNDAGKNEKVFLTLERELESCSEFALSVAFITQSGLQLFKPVLRQLQKKGIRGRILTTNYLAFTQPEALKTLLEPKGKTSNSAASPLTKGSITKSPSSPQLISVLSSE